MAAGRGSRMKGYEGSKTLLPLMPEKSPYEGKQPILIHIIENLPFGPKGVVVHHRKEEICKALEQIDVSTIEQPVLNGTGGALLAAMPFIEAQAHNRFLITMGDVPFVNRKSYLSLLSGLETYDLMVLGFKPSQKKQYGILEIHEDRVHRIIEWKYWKDFPIEKQQSLTICNAGIYAATQKCLRRLMPLLASRPHVVQKEVNGVLENHKEYFITDLVEYMVEENSSVGFCVADSEDEVMGIDDLSALTKAQAIYRDRQR